MTRYELKDLSQYAGKEGARKLSVMMTKEAFYDESGKTRKPVKGENGLIANLFKNNVFDTDLDIAQLAKRTLEGKTFAFSFCPMKNDDSFQYSDLVVLDFDDGLTINEFIECANDIKLDWLFIYPSFNYSEELNKFRAIFLLPEREIDKVKIKIIIHMLLQIIGTDNAKADSACKDVSRHFHGTNKDWCLFNKPLDTKQPTLDLIGLVEEYNNWCGKSLDNMKNARLLAKKHNLSFDNGIQILTDGAQVNFLSNNHGNNLIFDLSARTYNKNTIETIYTGAKVKNDDKRIEFANLYARLEYEPLYHNLKYGNDKFGYKKSVVLASNFRMCANVGLAQHIINLMRQQSHRFISTPIERCVDEVEKLFNFTSSFKSVIGYDYIGNDWNDKPHLEFINPIITLSNIYIAPSVKKVSECIYINDYIDYLKKHDWKANKKSLIINAGTGFGKTTHAIKNLPALIEELTGDKINLKYFLSSRIAIGEQTVNSEKTKAFIRYHDFNNSDFGGENGFSTVELIDNWHLHTYHKFSHLIAQEGFKSPDLIIVDEAHSIIKDSTFTGETSADVLDYLKNYEGYIVWLTATPENLLVCENQGATNFNYKLLFNKENLGENAMKYNTNKTRYHNTGNIKYVDRAIENNIVPNGEDKAFILLRSATEALRMTDRLRSVGYRVAFICSRWNTKEVSGDYIKVVYDNLPESIKKILDEKELAIISCTDLVDWEAYKYILDNERVPENIDIVICTSVWREGININDENVKLAITDFAEKTTAIQFRGRFRQNLNMFIIQNNQKYKGNVRKALIAYENLRANPTKKNLIDMYSEQEKEKMKYKLVLRKAVGDDYEYRLNQYCYAQLTLDNQEYNLTDRYKNFKESTNNMNNLLSIIANQGEYSIIPESDLHIEYFKRELLEIARKHAGAPMTEERQDLIIEEIRGLGFKNKDGDIDLGIKFVFNLLRRIGVVIKEDRANKKLAENYNVEYRKKYNFIVSVPI